MNAVIRDLEETDLEEVLRVNQRNIPKVGGSTIEEFESLFQMACFKRLVEDEEGVCGFMLCLLHGRPYKSPNYQWFVKNCKDFIYIDRIVLDERRQSNGIGSMLYAELLRYGEDSKIERLCCEVNIKPMNENSLRFHKKHGFEKVGEQETESGDTESGKKSVALLIRELGSAGRVS